jgi:hypothetical protein
VSRILELITSGNVILSSPSFNEKTMAGFEGGGGYGLDSEVYLFIDTHQLMAGVVMTATTFSDLG